MPIAVLALRLNRDEPLNAMHPSSRIRNIFAHAAPAREFAMRIVPAALFALFLASSPAFAAGWWPDAVEHQLSKAGANRGELVKALDGVPVGERAGMAFIVANMPAGDLTSLSAEFLLTNHRLAYQARREMPWGKDIPAELFLNDVLAYANVDEKRDPWRAEMVARCVPIVKGCKTPAEAAQKLNRELFAQLELKYAPQRGAPNYSPAKSIARKNASCTGLSIVLADACRAVCVPARLAGTPNWHDKRGNHTWVEVWDGGWHFTGACEADEKGLDRGWFTGDAARAVKGSPEHAIYAASFKKTDTHFPLVWARDFTGVPGEDVTDRYAAKKPINTEAARVSFRVVGADGKRVARPVTVIAGGKELSGTSRGESADLNDFFTLELPPLAECVASVGTAKKPFTTPKAGAALVVELIADSPSSRALSELRDALAVKPKSLADLEAKDFAKVPLSKADAAAARALIWEAHKTILRSERAGAIKNRVLVDGETKMPFAYTVFGPKPAKGHSLWISLHGGGNTRPAANDQQWKNQQSLYKLPEGIYLTPRAPTNTWNLWHEPHIDRLFTRLIADLIALEGIDPNRVYLLGYSAGGDGVYQLAPRLADHWAAAAMMAGHPNGVSLLSLRNVPFALQVGAEDKAYDRNTIGKEYGEKLDALQKADPAGYLHLVKIHPNRPHWMGGDDKLALPWMAKATRDPIPKRVVWKQTGVAHDRGYWLAVPPDEAKVGTLVIAERAGQRVTVTEAEGVKTLLVRLDDRVANLDEPMIVTRAGKELYRGTPKRTIGTLLKTLIGRGDPALMFDAEIEVKLAE